MMPNRRKSSQATLPPEEVLLDYAKQLNRHRADRRALHIRLSALTKFFRQQHHVRAATECFNPLLKSHEGQIFTLSNNDLVIVVKGASVSEIDQYVLKVRFMVRDDDNIRKADEAGDEILVTWFDIAHDYDGFRGFAQQMHETAGKPDEGPRAPAPAKIVLPADLPDTPGQPANDGASTVKASKSVKYFTVKPAAKPAQPVRPMDAEAYLRLEQAVKSMDVTPLVSKEPVTIITQEAPAQAIIHHRSVAINRLQKMVMPDRDLTSDPWLLGRLKGLLASRLMASEPDMANADSLASSMTVTAQSVFSETFERFEKGLGRLPRGRVILGFSLMEVIRDGAAYMEAQERVRNLGFRIALADIDLFAFPMLDRTVVASDFDMVLWRQDQAHLITGAYKEKFARSVRAAGAARIILTGCDTPEALKFGQDVGIRLFRGDMASAPLAQKG